MEFGETTWNKLIIIKKSDCEKGRTRMKVLIIDEQRLFADGIRYLLKNFDPNITTNYVGDIFKANEYIKSTPPPDLIFLDINDDGKENSYDLINSLNKLNLFIPLIVVSVNDSSEAAALAIENNASGFISKCSSREIVLEAIESVLEGKMFISKPKKAILCENKDVKVDKVTSRQKEVLYLLSQGLLNKQIANELNISANTVKAHLHDLFRSLQVNNRTAAVKNGQKYGLI